MNDSLHTSYQILAPYSLDGNIVFSPFSMPFSAICIPYQSLRLVSASIQKLRLQDHTNFAQILRELYTLHSIGFLSNLSQHLLIPPSSRGRLQNESATPLYYDGGFLPYCYIGHSWT